MSDKLKKITIVNKLKNKKERRDPIPLVVDIKSKTTEEQGKEFDRAVESAKRLQERIDENKKASMASQSEIGPWRSDLLPEMLVPRYGGKFESWNRPGRAEADISEKIVRAHPFQGPNTTAHEIGHLDPRMSWFPNREEKEIVAWDIARKILQDLGIIQDDSIRDAALKTYGVTLDKEQK